MQSYMARVKNAMSAFMFPAAGILIAIILFGTLTGFFVRAETGVSELTPGIYYPARLEPPQTPGRDLNLTAPVVIQAYVDANGRVQNYDIISGPDNQEVRSQLNRALLFTKFSPAYALGRPVASTAILSFSNVNVKG